MERQKVSGWRHLFVALPLAAAMSLVSAAATESAVANGDTRTINLVNAHTKESISATYMVNGQYDGAVLAKLNWFLRDWRIEKPTNMDPHLFDIVWNAYRLSGSHEPIVVLSGYRSPQTNAMLRRRSRLVAKFSQHMLGKAMDQHYVDVPMSKIREIAMKMQRGGVGYYPTSGTPFVHMDAGNVRSWPRMSYEQLARLFPDGKTVHIPSNGKPLPGYEEARREIIATGTAYAPISSVGKSQGFFAHMFGGDSGDEGEAAIAMASANSGNGDGNARTFFQSPTHMAAAPAATATPEPVTRVASVAARPALVRLPTANTQLALVSPAPKHMKDLIASKIHQTANVEAEPADAADQAQTVAEPEISLPLPPQRPSERLAALLAADVPMPPTLPVELASLDSNYIGYRAPSQPPLEAMADRHARGGKPSVLPDIITQDSSSAPMRPDHADNSVLAYADMPHTDLAQPRGAATKHTLAHFKLRTIHTKALAAPPMGDNAPMRGLKTARAAHNFRSTSIVGAVAPGLRSAVKAQEKSLFDNAPNSMSTSFVAQLQSMPTDRFTMANYQVN
ncbi:MAG: YcbK family protein [Hyphomicrobiales bacterium]|nr:YcbK family protein [Hyphomicrobiales bacterium]MDE2115357.1 DUF882 domain-containing protein [Hyphomicrobiales bacterium]